MGGLVHSQRVLLALTQAGLSREDSLCAGPAQRDEGVGIGRPAVAARPAQGRPRGHRSACRPTSSTRCSTSTIISSMSTRSSTGCSARRPNRFAKHNFLRALRNRALCCSGSAAGGPMDNVDEFDSRHALRSRSRRSRAHPAGGYLLELSLDWIVLRASENVHHLLGESHVTLDRRAARPLRPRPGAARPSQPLLAAQRNDRDRPRLCAFV